MERGVGEQFAEGAKVLSPIANAFLFLRSLQNFPSFPSLSISILGLISDVAHSATWKKLFTELFPPKRPQKLLPFSADLSARERGNLWGNEGPLITAQIQKMREVESLMPDPGELIRLSSSFASLPSSASPRSRTQRDCPLHAAAAVNVKAQEGIGPHCPS